MKTAQPDNSHPIPLRTATPNVFGILVRFIGLLFVTVTILVLIWSR